MAQFNHQLPDGTTLQAVDVETARRYLRRVVWSIMEGTPTELIIGTAERAQAVVLSPDAWLHDVELHDQQADSGAKDRARRRLDEVEQEWQSEEHFTSLLAGMVKERADPERLTPPFREQRVDAVDVQIAARLLDDVVTCLESGALEVLMLGERGVAEAVMIPIDYWLDYLGLEADETGDDRIAGIVRERIANGDPSKWVSEEEFRAQIKDPRKPRDD